MQTCRYWIFACCSWLLSSAVVGADGWPQWGGPDRNFEVVGPPLRERWAEGGPARMWTRPLGDGYAGIAYSDGRLYTMYRSDERESIVALDALTGRTVWQRDYPAPFLPDTDLQPGPGPHATPLVIGDRLCTAGVTGIVHCLELQTGEVIWRRNLVDDFAGTILFRGYSCNPLGYANSVILTVGGEGQGIVSLTLAEGTVKWKSQDFEISHASPLVIRFQDRDQLVVLASRCIVGVDPHDGTLLWTHDHPTTGGYIASMPVWARGDRLFFSFAYGGGSRCLQLTGKNGATTVTEMWHNKRMRIHHSNAIARGDYVYASSGDFGPKLFSAIQLSTGKLAWQQRLLGRSSLVKVNDKFVILREDGQLSLATLSPQSVLVHARAQLFQERAWTPPTVVGNRLYIRNRTAIMAYDLPVRAR